MAWVNRFPRLGGGGGGARRSHEAHKRRVRGRLAYGAHLVHVPYVWIGVGSLVLIDLRVMSAVSHTKLRDQPKQTPETKS